ncbi:MAG: TatD family hydrolase, partial [Chloroflexota bacterium]
AAEKGVGVIINVGINIESSRVLLEMAHRHSNLFVAVGFHPNESFRMGEGDMKLLAELARDKKVVAIGETGLDFYRKKAHREQQLQAFKAQLDLARELSLPVIIHGRQAHEEIIEILRGWVKSLPPGGTGRGVVHCFNGDRALAQRYLDLGFYLSVTGTITYPSARDQAEVLKELPLERLMVETDCPFLAPQLYRGKRNEPAYVALVVEKIAQLKGIPVEKVAQATTENAVKLFRLPTNG